MWVEFDEDRNRDERDGIERRPQLRSDDRDGHHDRFDHV
jgi:hypothetical protein